MALALAVAVTNRGERRSSAAISRAVLHAELQRLDRELARYAEAIAETGPVASLLTSITLREQRRNAIQAELATLPSNAPAEDVDLREMKARIRARVEKWRSLAREHVTEGRRLLRSSDRAHTGRAAASHPPAEWSISRASRPEEGLGELGLSLYQRGLWRRRWSCRNPRAGPLDGRGNDAMARALDEADHGDVVVLRYLTRLALGHAPQVQHHNATPVTTL